MQTSLGKRSLGIDLLRCFSLLLVVFDHYGIMRNFFLSGTHGVVIFFMVSGYCMAYSMENRNGKQFLLARFWRLVPTLIICASLTELIEVWFSSVVPDRGQSFSHYIANIFCLPLGNLFCDAISNLFRGTSFTYSWVDGAYWSLLVEIRFYLLLWVFYYLLKIKFPIFILASLSFFSLIPLEWDKLSKSNDFLIYLPFFSFGMAFGKFTRQGSRALWLMFYCFLVFLFISYFGVNAISMSLNRSNLFSYGSCFLIFLMSMLLFRRGNNKWVSYLGVITYPLYLLHQDIGLVFISLIEKNSLAPAAFIVLGFVILMALAVNSLVERYQVKVQVSLSRLKLMI
jgi:peptidoglycan/LPS O-acetylase OafA/YrhL